MTLTDAFILVIPALLLLLGAGALAPHIERMAYYLHDAGELRTVNGMAPHQIETTHGESRRELERLRVLVADIGEHIESLQKERASLLGQERALADVTANFVAEVGYPTVGALGYFIKMEGPSKEMPFAGLASVATALSGRRQVRLVTWGLAQVEAQNFAMNWGGDGMRILNVRPFEGRLLWHEA
ncbi:hypothetical protein [Ferrovibrio sp.]|uniref:hypothetical protein n=1 Tax=Ferrovibrio sp. TaxID=1917215 RepID=UPI0026283B58|nr:hypothetical protein [Ferrovibrio sp.]